MVAGFLFLERHSNTNSLTVFGDAGNGSNLKVRQNSPKTSQSALHALKVFAANAPTAIPDQSAKRSAGTRPREESGASTPWFIDESDVALSAFRLVIRPLTIDMAIS
jgi:hypothetical protein